MFISCNYIRTLKVVVAGLAIFAAACIPAAGQEHDIDVEHSQLPDLFEPMDRHELNDELSQGVNAYKSARYDEAILHFQQAMKLAPDQLGIKIWLGTALAQKVAPGVDTPQNLKTAQRAIDIFQEILNKTPFDVTCMKEIARIDFNIKKLDESKAWQKKVLTMDVKDAEAAFAVGVIDWMQARQNAQAALTQAGLKDDSEGNAKAPAAVMESIKAQNSGLIKEALQYLNQAVNNRPDFADAMSNLSLAYRRKADLDYGNETARKEDLIKADEWRSKAMETRGANKEKKNAEADFARP
ncbi:MAG: tetratricopeptide repeat protein [Terracidiphilus sp.]